jgi:putative transposase
MKLVKRIKLKVNKKCREYLEFASEQCRLLYNFSLAKKIDLYKKENTNISIYELKKELPEIKKQFPKYSKVYNKCLSEMYFRMEKAYKRFFKEKNGFPKFKRKGDFISQEYPGEYIKIINEKSFIIPTGKGCPNFTAITKEKIPRNFSTLILKKDRENYFACFTFEHEEKKGQNNKKILAVDLGIKTLVTGVSTNNVQVTADKFSHYTKHLDVLRSNRDKKQKGSRRWKKWNLILHKNTKKYINRVNDYLHKVSKWLAFYRNESTIVVGKLNLKNMKGENSWFNRILLNEWRIGRFVSLLDYKCKKFGKNLVRIDESYTTQTCCRCGNRKKLNLNDRIYICKKCGLKIDRDLNSAINILYGYAKAINENAELIKSKIVNKFGKKIPRDLKLDTFVYI